MSVKVEIGLTIVIVALCSMLVLAGPNDRIAPNVSPRLAHAAKRPVERAQTWAESLANECLKIASGQQS